MPAWRHAMALAAALALGVFASPADARLQRVAPGKVPVLAADEGFVLVAVDTNVPISHVRLRKDGKLLGTGTMGDIEEGRSFALYVATAGRYQWRDLRVRAGIRYGLADDPEFSFAVEPGRVTYGGDVVFRPITLWRATIRVANRGLAAMDWLETTHPAIAAAHPFAFSGHYPDPFPGFYRDERGKATSPVKNEDVPLAAPPAPGTLPLDIATLWKPGRITAVRLDPAGRLLALEIRNGEKDWAIELVDLEAGTATVMARSAVTFDSIEWGGDGVLVLAYTTPQDGSRVSIVRRETQGDGSSRFVQLRIPRRGYVVDPLPSTRDALLFGSRGSDGKLMVHRMDISSQAAIDAFVPKMRERLNVGVEDDIGWFADGAGRLRLALARRDDAVAIFHGADGVFREVMRLDEDTKFDPLAASGDGAVLYGVSEEGRGQRELVAFDIASGQQRTLFSRPGVDIQGVLLDARHFAIGATYYQEGRRVSEYFDATQQAQGASLAAAFPGRTVSVAGRSASGDHLVAWVDAGDLPPRLYHFDRAKRSASLVDEHMPWLAETAFAPTVPIAYRGVDGLPLEAFLTLPAGKGARPLVVMPHGGPVGVADRLHFDRDVQFIASLGYAVLRVNFRGSDGYGKAFREAGHRQHGTLIEDDIDAAIQHVLARHPLDASRMCVVGSSYGGYSALVSAVRWPERFRCVASIAGVSDRILFFTASDAGHSETLRKLAEKVIGDPNTEADRMRETSPLYRYREMQVPVFLAHGLEDARVDYEHTRRMARMLAMAGRPAVGLRFQGEGHGIVEDDNRVKLWSGVAGFLRAHLGDAATVPSSKASARVADSAAPATP